MPPGLGQFPLSLASSVHATNPNNGAGRSDSPPRRGRLVALSLAPAAAHASRHAGAPGLRLVRQVSVAGRALARCPRLQLQQPHFLRPPCTSTATHPQPMAMGGVGSTRRWLHSAELRCSAHGVWELQRPRWGARHGGEEAINYHMEEGQVQLRKQGAAEAQCACLRLLRLPTPTP